MTTHHLERTAYTVECFLNALRLEDGSRRVSLEEELVRWFMERLRHKDDFILFQPSPPSITCYSEEKPVYAHPIPEAVQKRTLWSNGRQISIINGHAFSETGKLVMLGTAGLLLTMPGMPAAAAGQNSYGASFEQRSSNNNNNNNNNG